MSKNSIVIIDYGMGNIRSVLNKISRSGHLGIVSDEIEVIKCADKLILPGVGHFRNGMINLHRRNLIDILNLKVIQEKTPILGICLGMQLFSSHSEEGDCPGLNWIESTTTKFTLNDIRHKVPHMGWNSLKIKKHSTLLENLPPNKNFYFVHSFHVNCKNSTDILATSLYGYEFVSAIQKDNIYGTQFHPEKSHEWGEQLLNNFLNL